MTQIPKTMSTRYVNLILLVLIPIVVQAQTAVGGDISMIPAYEAAGDKWLDHEGHEIPDLIEYLRDHAGWNSARVRLMVDPTQDNDPATCQDLQYVKTLGERIKRAGMNLLLDIFYSDTWTDPAQQWIPKSWDMNRNTPTETLAERVAQYTRESIDALVQAGVTPDYVQIGNEVSYGMLWDNLQGKNSSQNAFYLDPQWASYDKYQAQIKRFATLLNSAAQGVRSSQAPNARIILHIERSGESGSASNFYTWVQRAGFTDFDIIGLSYYPFWHGNLDDLTTTVRTLQSQMPTRPIHLVETAYNYQWGPSDALCHDWPYTPEGQAQFLSDLAQRLITLGVQGMYYWFPEECGNGHDTKIQLSWLNRGLWQNSDQDPRHPLNSPQSLAAFKQFSVQTSISSPSPVSPHATPTYNLQGQRLDTDHIHGISITQGTKQIRP